jgi:hypothetical protein
MVTGCMTQKKGGIQSDMSCAVEQPVILEDGERVVYKANLNIFNKSFGGLLVLANIDSLYKVSFLSDMGISFFDMIIRKTDYEVVHCIEPMNKRRFLNSFVRKIRFLIESPSGFTPYYAESCDSGCAYSVRDHDRWVRGYCSVKGQVKTIIGYRWGKRMVINIAYGKTQYPVRIESYDKRLRFSLKMDKVNL